jgi:hypothetical protein
MGRRVFSDQGLYFIKFQKYVKIGISTNMALRISTIQSYLPEKLKVLATFKYFGCYETQIHQQLDHLRVRGEWFLFSDEITQMIRSLKTSHRLINWDRETIIPIQIQTESKRAFREQKRIERQKARDRVQKAKDRLQRLNDLRRAPYSLAIPEKVIEAIAE